MRVSVVIQEKAADVGGEGKARGLQFGDCGTLVVTHCIVGDGVIPNEVSIEILDKGKSLRGSREVKIWLVRLTASWLLHNRLRNG